MGTKRPAGTSVFTDIAPKRLAGTSVFTDIAPKRPAGVPEHSGA